MSNFIKVQACGEEVYKLWIMVLQLGVRLQMQHQVGVIQMNLVKLLAGGILHPTLVNLVSV